jgi:hypothetical protein
VVEGLAERDGWGVLVGSDLDGTGLAVGKGVGVIANGGKVGGTGGAASATLASTKLQSSSKASQKLISLNL